MKKIILLFAVSFMLLNVANAQKIKVVDGDLSFFKDLSELNVIYEYPEDMKLGKTTLEEYVAKKVGEKEKKKEGSGEAWKEAFYADRADHYEPMFIRGLDDKTGDLYVAQDDSDYPVTVIVKTTFMEPGFQMGFQSKNSAVDLELTFVDTENHENVKAVVVVTKAPGAAAPDQGLRVGDAYFTAGQAFGKFLKKKKYL